MHHVGGVHHVALNVRQLDHSQEFYRAILLPMGYREGVPSSELRTFVGAEGELLLYQSPLESRVVPHNRFSPGLHHLCFRVGSRILVNTIFAAAVSSGAEVLNGPREYPEYSPQYFAAYFMDLDGMKLEIAHFPDYLPTDPHPVPDAES